MIGDFTFNVGQPTYSSEIPYGETAIKVSMYQGDGELGKLISKLRSDLYKEQNEAMKALRKISPAPIVVSSHSSRDQQFILGRSLYRASGNAFSVMDEFKSLNSFVRRYSQRDGTNHLLNGMLFEIYFDESGCSREVPDRWGDFASVLALSSENKFSMSFEFIHRCLSQYESRLFYIPGSRGMVDVNINASESVDSDGNAMQIICEVSVDGRNILQEVAYYHGKRGYDYWMEELELKKLLSEFLMAPVKVIELHSAVKLSKCTIKTGELPWLDNFN